MQRIQQGAVESIDLEECSEGLTFWKLLVVDKSERNEVRIACDGPVPIRPGDRMVCDGDTCYWTSDNDLACNIPFFQVAC